MKRIPVVLVALGSVFAPEVALACGCFAQPSPATPVVQAGERILFAHEGNQVVAYIQIQYQGSASQFGWLVPLPSVPTLQIGTDEVFTTLGQTTQPDYYLTTTRKICGGGSRSYGSPSVGGCGAFGAASAGHDTVASADLGAAVSDAAAGPVVVRSSIGPYDYAVLRADNQTEMLNWLQTNRYFVPSGTDAAVAPYIHPGGYFLALKLRSGESAGDVTPIILRYASDLAMIPITLTQVGAVPDMGIQVWVLGQSRAVPRNYYHVVLDELPIWINTNGYSALVTRAMHEAPKRHAFATEYAGTSSVMTSKLDWSGRFGNLGSMRAIAAASDYLRYLFANQYTFDSTLLAILERYIPEPPSLAQSGVTPFFFYLYYDTYANQLVDDGGAPPAFDAVHLTDEIDQRIVQPTRAAQALFDANPYLTRLVTVLSPEDMNSDPVFSYNPDLPDVPLSHRATLTVNCNANQWIASDQGFRGELPLPQTLPAALRIEVLRESGPAQVLTDNQATIASSLAPADTSDVGGPTPTPSPSPYAGGRGCACQTDGRPLQLDVTVLLALAGVALSARLIRRRKARLR